VACAQRSRPWIEGGQWALKLPAAMLFGAGLLCVCAAAAVTQQTSEPAPAPSLITDGPTLFRESGCAHCHTIRGVGGNKGPDLSGAGRRLKKDAIERQIVSGGGAMPEFGDVLPADEIKVLVKYLHKCKDKKPSPANIAPAPPAPEIPSQ
jgi:mono/diheme cytochrome c family protein